MTHLPYAVLTLICCALLTTKASVAETHENSQRGFSLEIPAGWVLADDDTTEAVNKAAGEVVEAVLDIQASKYDAYLFDPASVQDDTVASINVISNSGRLSFTDKFVDELATTIRTQFEAGGMQLEGFSPELKTFGANDGLLFEYTVEFPNKQIPAYNWQFFVAGREKYYIIVCSVPESLADAYQNTCLEVLESFKVDIGVAGFLSSIPPIFRDGIQGVLIALVVGAFLRWRASRTGVKIGELEPPPSIKP